MDLARRIRHALSGPVAGIVAAALAAAALEGAICWRAFEIASAAGRREAAMRRFAARASVLKRRIMVEEPSTWILEGSPPTLPE